MQSLEGNMVIQIYRISCKLKMGVEIQTEFWLSMIYYTLV